MKRKIIALILLTFILNANLMLLNNVTRNFLTNFKDNDYSIEKFNEPQIINQFTVSNKVDFPPYIEKYIGTTIIQAIDVDSANNRLFYSTGNSIGILNLNNYSFREKSLTILDCAILQLLYENNSENLFVATTIGLFITNTNNWESVFYNESNGLSNNYVQSIAYDIGNKKLFLSTFDGLNILFLNNHSFMENTKLPLELRFGSAGRIAYNANINTLYLTAGNKLLCYNITENNLTEIFYSNNYNYDSIRSLDFHRETNILYLGCHGVIIFNCSTNTVTKNYNQTSGLISNVVYDITYSANYGGIIFAEQDSNGFATINVSSSEIDIIRREDGLLTNVIGSLKIYNENQSSDLLLIGLRGGISFYSITNNTLYNTLVFNFGLPSVYTRQISVNSEQDLIFLSVEEYFTIFNISSKEFLNYDYVYGLPEASIRQTVYNSKSKQVFVSTYLGVYIFSLEEEQVVRCFTTNQGLSNNSTYSLFYLEEENTLYIGTHTGLDKIDLTTNIVSNCLTTIGKVRVIHGDLANERLFFAASSDLQIFNLVTETNYSANLSSVDYNVAVNSLAYYREDNVLFAGTSNGLYLIDSDSFRIQAHFTPENSQLTAYLVEGISFDEESEKLFIANMGVVVYDYRHDFWINLNEARLEEENLHGIYIEDILYSNEKLYLAAPYNGFYIIVMSDTDQDGLEDCFEEWLFKTNKALFDTDNDGYGDGEELWSGTDPLDPKSYPRKTLEWWVIVMIITMAIVTPIVSVFIYKRRKNTSLE